MAKADKQKMIDTGKAEFLQEKAREVRALCRSIHQTETALDAITLITLIPGMHRLTKEMAKAIEQWQNALKRDLKNLDKLCGGL